MSSPASGTETNLGCGVSSSSIAMSGVGTFEVVQVNFAVNNPTNNGNVTLQWAQQNSRADLTTVNVGTTMFTMGSE